MALLECSHCGSKFNIQEELNNCTQCGSSSIDKSKPEPKVLTSNSSFILGGSENTLKEGVRAILGGSENTFRKNNA